MVYFFIQYIIFTGDIMIYYLKSLVYSLGIILGGTIILTIFNYFNILNGIFLIICAYLIPIIAIFIGSFLIGRTTNKKGYLEGIKYGGIWVISLLLVSIILRIFTLYSFILYTLILLSSIGGAILGINLKKN